MNQNEAANVLTGMQAAPERWEDLGRFTKHTGAVIVTKESGVTTSVFAKPVFKDPGKEIEKLQAEKIKTTELEKKYSDRHDLHFKEREYLKAEQAEKHRKEYDRNVKNLTLRIDDLRSRLPEMLKDQISEIDLYIESVQTSVINPVLEERKLLYDQLSEKGKR